MANLSEDIQCAGSNTRPPMLDRTDFASWKQRIRPERARVYSDLSPEDKDRYNADIRATNILLQGLPKDIYTLINHYTEAKDIWDNVKMLLEGSELTKEDRESQLYDDFEHFRQNKGETIHDYYLLWLFDANTKAHANENKMMLDRFTQHTVDPLALMSNVSQQQTSSNTRNQATVQDDMVVIQNVQGRHNRDQGNNARGACAAGYGGAQNRVRNANPGQARQIKCYNCNGIGNIVRNCTQPKRPHNSKYFKYKMLLMQAQENGVALDEEQLLFIAADVCDAFDFDVDEAPTAQTMFMANLSSTDPVYDEASPSYDSDILSEVPNHDNYQDAVCEPHEVHEIYEDVQPNCVVDSHVDYTSYSNMILYD
ncbi:retrovirus-related pol polyprotein from transposon TNT 1-94 [Tanacetum coccineum]